jgi:hypothetical protein
MFYKDKQKKFWNKKLKGVKVFLIIYGGAMAAISLISTIMFGFLWRLSGDDDFFIMPLIFIPFLVLVGLAFLFSGIYIKKIKFKRSLLHLIISLLSVVWYFLFIICIKPHHDSFLDPNNPDLFGVIFTILPYIIAIAYSAIFIVPEFIIWRNLKKIEKHLINNENIDPK